MGKKLSDALFIIVPYVAVFLMGVFWDVAWGRPKVEVYVTGPVIIALSVWIRRVRRKTEELGT